MTTLTHPAAVLERLQQIEEDLADKMGDYEEAARQYAFHKRDWEKKLAQCQIVAPGANAEMRKANALLAAVASDDTYEGLKTAEGNFEGCRAVVKVLETRAMIGMAILRSQGRS